MEQNANIDNQENSFDYKELFFLCLSKWKWFLLSLIICLGLAAAKVLTTMPTYSRSASLLVKDDKKGNNFSSDISDAFSSMGITTGKSNVYNEELTISSPANVMDVVKRLDLTTEYRVKGRFHDNVIYGSSLPVKVSFINVADNLNCSFNLNIGKSLKFSGFKEKGKAVSGEVSGSLGDTLTTPVGKIVVTKNEGFVKSGDGDDLAEIKVIHSPLNSVVRSCSSRLNVSLTDKMATILGISFSDLNIQRAEEFINTLISTYNENWVKDKNQMAISTSQFISDRLDVIERELGNVDTDISSYKSEHLLPDVEEASKMYMNKANEAETNVMELNNEVYMAKYIRSYLANSDDFKLLPANSGIQNQSIATLINDYNTKLLQRNNLVANSSETNPLVVDMDQALRSIRSAIISSIDNELVTLNSQISSQKKYGSTATSQLASNPDQAKYLLSVERQQKVKESLYLYLLQKREENELSQAFTAYNSRVITPPYGSNIPVAPKRNQILLIALLLGLAIPFGIIYLVYTLDTSIKGRKDIEGKVSLPFTGEIPYWDNGGKKGLIRRHKIVIDGDTPIVVEHGNRNYINEAFRVLRTNIEFLMGKSADNNVAVITSFNAGSGKSFIINNLAVSLAIRNKKVLLIDCDLRKASSSRIYGNPKTGLSNYLGGFVDNIDDVIIQYEGNEHFFILPVGAVPPNPSELLADDKFAGLISELRPKYDFIFLDCPPVEIVADTAIIEKYADRTLFVMRAGLFDKSMLPVLESDFRTGKYKNLSLILNGTEVTSGYGYKYGYRYGYNYGYNYEYSSKKS